MSNAGISPLQSSATNRFPNETLSSPALWAVLPPRLHVSVGPGQPNLPSDVRLVQKLVNICLSRGYLLMPTMPPGMAGTNPRLLENGIWTHATHRALINLEFFYFHGRANPHGVGVVEPRGSLFRFLVDLVRQHKIAEQTLAPEMTALAKAMVPDAALQNIQKYLPLILDSLQKRSLADTDMILLALATIYVETWVTTRFVPTDEKVSSANTVGTRVPTGDGNHTRFVPTGPAFGRYDSRADIGNVGSPDGSSFRGRGFTQLTGRDNYSTYSRELDLKDKLVNDPAFANDPYTAAEIIAQYFKRHETAVRSALARNNLREIRAIVNGADSSYTEFRDSFNRGRKFIGEQMIQDLMAVAAQKRQRAGRPKAGGRP
jgi:hypothetical protein